MDSFCDYRLLDLLKRFRQYCLTRAISRSNKIINIGKIDPRLMTCQRQGKGHHVEGREWGGGGRYFMPRFPSCSSPTSPLRISGHFWI